MQEKIIFDDFLTKEGEFAAVEIELKKPPINTYLTAIYNFIYSINTPSQVISKLLPSVIVAPVEAQKIDFFANEIDYLNKIFDEVLGEDLEFVKKINTNDFDPESKELIFEYDNRKTGKEEIINFNFTDKLMTPLEYRQILEKDGDLIEVTRKLVDKSCKDLLIDYEGKKIHKIDYLLATNYLIVFKLRVVIDFFMSNYKILKKSGFIK